MGVHKMFLSLLVKVFLIVQVAARRKLRSKRELDRVIRRSDIAIRNVRFGTYLRSYKYGRHWDTWFQSFVGPWERLRLKKIRRRGYSIRSRTFGTYLRADLPWNRLWWQRSVGPYEIWDLKHIRGTKWTVRSWSPSRCFLRGNRYRKRAYLVPWRLSYEVFEIMAI